MSSECFFCNRDGLKGISILEAPYVSPEGKIVRKDKFSCEECYTKFRPVIYDTLKQAHEFFWRQLDCIKAMDTAAHIMSGKE